MLTHWLVLLSLLAGGYGINLDGHFSDLKHVLFRGVRADLVDEARAILADEHLTRNERNHKLQRWAEHSGIQETFTYFLNKEREYEHHIGQDKMQKPHQITQASRIIRKMARCPRATDQEKMAEMPDEMSQHDSQVQSILKILYPSLADLQHLDMNKLREELEQNFLQEIEDKNLAILDIAQSNDKSPYHKKQLIGNIIQSANSQVTAVLRRLWRKIPGVHAIKLSSSSKNRSHKHPKDLSY